MFVLIILLIHHWISRKPPPFLQGRGPPLPKFGKDGNQKFGKGGGFLKKSLGSPPLPKFFVATLPKLGKGGNKKDGKGGFLKNC